MWSLKVKRSSPVEHLKHKIVDWKRTPGKLLREIWARRKSLAKRNQSSPIFSDLNWVKNVQRLANMNEILLSPYKIFPADRWRRINWFFHDLINVEQKARPDVIFILAFVTSKQDKKNRCFHFELTRNASCSTYVIGLSLGTGRDEGITRKRLHSTFRPSHFV